MTRKLFILLLSACCAIASAQPPKLVLPIGHRDGVEIFDFSPDGKYFVSGSRDKTAKVWNVNTGDLLLDLQGHSNHLTTVKYSPDGKMILTTSYDGKTVDLWNAANGTLLKSLRVNRWLRAAAFSPDGKEIVCNDWDSLKIWNVETGKMRLGIGAGDEPYTLEYSADGKQILNRGHYATLYNAADGTKLFTIAAKHETLSAKFSPDGKKIITVIEETPIQIWNAGDGSLLRSYAICNKPHYAEFRADEKNFLVECNYDDDSATVFNSGDGAVVVRININNAQYSRDGKYIIGQEPTSYFDHGIILLKASDGSLIKKFTGHTYGIYFSAFSPDDRNIITATAGGMTLWDKQGFVTGSVKMGLQAISPDGRYTAGSYSRNDTDYIVIRDILTGTVTKQIIEETKEEGEERRRNGLGRVTRANYSPDGKLLVTCSDRAYAKLWDLATGKKILEVRAGDRLNNAFFTKDGKELMVLYATGISTTIEVWDWKAKKEVDEFNWLSNVYGSALVNGDTTRVYTLGYYDTVIQVWDYHSQDPKFNLVGHRGNIRDMQFSPDDKYVITASDDKTARIWDAETGKLLNILTGHDAEVTFASFSPDGKLILTASNDNTSKVWDAGTGNLKYSFFSVNGDFFYLTPAGYYFCTPAAAKLLHYAKGLNAISFQQLDIKYNRPDKVLEAIGNSDRRMIAAYRKAYYKRLRKMGIDTSYFSEGYSLPEADFTGRDTISYEQRNRTLTLHFSGSDSSYLLERYNVWVNEVPVFGSRGINIRKRKLKNIDGSVEILLSDGENKIEVSVTNVNGTESYHIPLQVKYIPATAAIEKTYFIGIGINNFQDKKYNLRWSVKDVRDMAVKLRQTSKGEFIIDTLFNEAVTLENIKQLKNKLLQTTVNDKVVIAYSGHGLLSRDYDYYLSTYGINFSQPEEAGLPYDELEALLDSIPARKKLMLIDACHSGEVDKDELADMIRVQKKLDNTKGADEFIDTTRLTIGIKNSFELMQELFTNVGKTTGATVISAASGTQFALEKDDLENGVFTYSILEAMKNKGTLHISELKQMIGKRVMELTNGRQKPTFRNETIGYDWNAW